MTAAAATSSEPTPSVEHEPPRADASLSLVAGDAEQHTAEAEAVAEHGVFRDAVIGAIIGALVCAPIWAGLVLIALRNADTALLPAVTMAAGVGLIAGAFLGGWAGTLVGSTALEHFERETRPHAPHAAP